VLAGGQVPQVGPVIHPHGQQAPISVHGAGVVFAFAHGGWADQRAVAARRSDLPKPQLVVALVARGQQLVVLAEAQALRPGSGIEQLLSRPGIPEAHGAVPAGTGEQVTAVVEGKMHAAVPVSLQANDLIARRHVPDLNVPTGVTTATVLPSGCQATLHRPPGSTNSATTFPVSRSRTWTP